MEYRQGLASTVSGIAEWFASAFFYLRYRQILPFSSKTAKKVLLGVK